MEPDAHGHLSLHFVPDYAGFALNKKAATAPLSGPLKNWHFYLNNWLIFTEGYPNL